MDDWDTMIDFQDLVPTQEDFEFLANWLDTQDAIGAMGKCQDFMDEAGYCKMCTAIQRLNELIRLMKDEDAWIGTK